jgi:antitoxin (DNA-binding transcriptional repressor) of toxin-antitoxin stability system
MKTITLKQLHAKTGSLVRRAGRAPVQVTDRGRPIAIITSPGTPGVDVFGQIRRLRSRLALDRDETARDLVNAGRRV